QHQQDQQAYLAVAGAGHQPVAEAIGDTGAHQAIADNEQRGNQQDVGVAEAGQGAGQVEQAAEWQYQQHQQGDGVHARFVADKQYDGDQQQAEYGQQWAVTRHQG